MADSWNKKEREKKKAQSKKEKAERKAERKEQGKSGNSLDSMLAYVDENGNISSTPPDPNRKREVNAEDIVIGVPKHVHNPEDDIRTGIITFFNDSKGYGFIRDTETRQSIFVHINALSEPVKENMKVQFEVEQGPRGLNAVRVKVVR